MAIVGRCDYSAGRIVVLLVRLIVAVNLNIRAAAVCREIVADAERLGVATSTLPGGTRVIDCGVEAPGGLAAGAALARVCAADLARVEIEPLRRGPASAPFVMVQTDHPWLACMASQYAGWEIKGEGFFAMGSGPMRAAAAREPLFAELEYRESAAACVGALEADALPTDEVACMIAEKCGVAPAGLTLLAAPTRSLAGTVQVVARSVETALHKLHELKFDLKSIASGWGCAPLPPPAADKLAAIGRTNDAILYGGGVTLYVHGGDDELAAIGAQLPSSASRDYGRPFAEVLASYRGDFYQVDPLLFSPAVVTLVNLATGRSFTFGELNSEVLANSFGETA